MPALGPWIGEQDEDTSDAGGRQGPQQRAHVIGPQPYVVQSSLVDGGQHLDHTLLERLTADQADARVVTGLPYEMLATTKTDLEPNLFAAPLENGNGKILRRCIAQRVDIDSDAWKQIIKQLALVGGDLATTTPTEGAQIAPCVKLSLVSVVAHALKSVRF